MNIALLGDSLFARLNKTKIQNLESKIPGSLVINCAMGGIDSTDLVREAPLLAKLPVDAFLISIGMNDIAPWKVVPFDAFEQNIRSLIGIFGQERTVFFLAPDVDEEMQSGPDKRLNATLAHYNQALQEICATLGVRCVDASSEFKAQLASGNDYHQADGVHLNDSGDEIMFSAIARMLQS